jgi:hypothetical protein
MKFGGAGCGFLTTIRISTCNFWATNAGPVHFPARYTELTPGLFLLVVVVGLDLLLLLGGWLLSSGLGRWDVRKIGGRALPLLLFRKVLPDFRDVKQNLTIFFALNAVGSFEALAR